MVGAGSTGLGAAVAATEAGARVLVFEKGDAGAGGATGLKVLSRSMVLDVILSTEGDAAGVLVVDRDAWELSPVRAKSVVLTGGSIGTLYPDPRHPDRTGDGFAMAHRAGAELHEFRVVFPGNLPVVSGGVCTDRDGATDVPGLFVAGLASDGRVEGRFAGVRAASETTDEFPPFGAYRQVPNIDSPLPEGFTDVKLQRLQALMQTHFSPEGPRDPKAGIQGLLRLKGEADEFARARVDPAIFSFQNAVEVALLIARAAEERNAT